MNLNDVRLVVITGAGSGIGRATALRFAALGATVIVTDLDEHTARDTTALIAEAGGTAHAYQLDVTDVPAFEAFAERIKNAHGVADVVVNNAGIVKIGNTRTHSVADWQKVLAVNLSGVVHGCRLFGAQLVERGRGGHLVNLSSAAAFMPTEAGPAYCASKAAVRMLSESLSAELAADRIGVTAICPSLINTNFTRSADYLGTTHDQAGQRNKAVFDATNRATSIGLASQPTIVAAAIVRSVRLNKVVVPVRPDAWLFYALHRFAPGAMRLIARLSSENTVDKISQVLIKPTIARRVNNTNR